MSEKTTNRHIATLERRITALEGQTARNGVGSDSAEQNSENEAVASPSTPTAIQDPSSDSKNANRRQKKPTPRWMGFLNNIGIVAGIGSAFFSYLLWQSTLVVMHEDQRAWLIPTQDPMEFADGQPIGEIFHYFNKGRTPAKRVVSEFVMLEVHENDRLSFQYGMKRSSLSHTGAVFSDVRIDQGVPLLSESSNGTLKQITFDEDTKGQYLTGQIMFLVYGKIEYFDVFGESHWVHYCTMTFAPQGLSHSSSVSRDCSAYTDTDDQRRDGIFGFFTPSWRF